MLGVTLAPSLIAAAVALDVGGGAQVEASGGQAPMSTGLAPEATFVSTVAPALGLQLDLGRTELRVEYGARLFMRQPNVRDESRPLVTHNGNVALEHRTDRSRWSARASGITGELDYLELSEVLGRAQSALPSTSRFAQGQVAVEGAVDLSRLWQVAVTASVEHMRPLDDDVLPPPEDPSVDPVPDLLLTFPRQTTYTLAPRALHRLSRSDELQLRSDFTYVTHSTGLRVGSWMPQVGWRRLLDRASSLDLLAGVVYAPLNESDDRAGDSLIAPLASAALLVRTGMPERPHVAFGAEGSVGWYIDPVLARAASTGSIAASAAVVLPPRWRIGVEGSFITSLEAEPFEGNPDETLIVASLPVHYRFSEALWLEFGGRFVDRGPHLGADDFAFRGRELWIYAQVTAAFTTRRGAARATRPDPVRGAPTVPSRDATEPPPAPARRPQERDRQEEVGYRAFPE